MVPELISKIDELRAIAAQFDEPGLNTFYKIGIGITTHNRPEVFAKTYSEIQKYSPDCKIVVVDDASVVPAKGATFRFDTNVGIARAKNKCFELLDDCDHIFLFDDDIFPITHDWFLPYILSPEPHLMYIFEDFKKQPSLNDNMVVYKGADLVAYHHPRGCMCYFKHVCLEKVGGMSPQFGRWGWEHPDLSNRIFNAGLTSFRYADVPNSDQLFYCGDENQTVVTTVGGNERQKWINRNHSIYAARQNSIEYVPYKEKSNLILTCYYNGVPDPQRSDKWEANIELIHPLIKSVEALNGAKMVILSDCLPLYDDGTVKVVRDECVISPYFQRWVGYSRFLRHNYDTYDKVFCVDATDVEVLKEPFGYLQPGDIFTGYEHEKLTCEWMTRHHRNAKLDAFYKMMPDAVLLNAGVMGGHLADVVKVCTNIVATYNDLLYQDRRSKTGSPGQTDMGVFNYVLRTLSGINVKYGPEICTRFKANERTEYSLFKHK